MDEISLAMAEGSAGFPREAGLAAHDPTGDASGAGECAEPGALPPTATPGVGDADALAESAADAADRSLFGAPLEPPFRSTFPFSSKTLKRSSMSCSSRPFDGITTY